MQLIDDGFQFYLADPTTISPLDNDTALPSGATLVYFPSFFDPGIDVELSADRRAFNIDGRAIASSDGGTVTLVFRYGVLDDAGEIVTTTESFGFTEPVRAEVTLTGLFGPAGLGGNGPLSFGTFIEGDSGRFDLVAAFDPFDRYDVTILAASGQLNDQTTSISAEVEFDIVDGALVMDTDAWAYLEAGQVARVTTVVEVTNGTETATRTINLVVEGRDDPALTVTTSDAAGAQTGSTGNDRIVSVPNEINIMTGGVGADVFVFGSDYSDGNADYDVITDFDAGRDLLVFSDGVVVREVMPLTDGLVIFTEDGDVLTIYGDGLDIEDTRVEGMTFRDASGNTVSVDSQARIDADLAEIFTLQTFAYWYI